MALKMNQALFQCSGCKDELDLKSKTLPCLHSYCWSCLERNFGKKKNGNCPECEEPFVLDQLNLSPFLVTSLRFRQLESTDCKCDLCLEDGTETSAKNWCHVCQKFFCGNCSIWHKKFHPNHNSKDLVEIEKDKELNIMSSDMCSLHERQKQLICKWCYTCLCDMCRQTHSTDSPQCESSTIRYVKDEASDQRSQCHTLAREMKDLEINLQKANQQTKKSIDKLTLDCDTKCKELWQNFEEIVANARQKTEKLCEDMKKLAAGQVEKWSHTITENEKILKQLEICNINLRYLLHECQQNVDVLYGLRLLESKLTSWLQYSVGSIEKGDLNVTFSHWWPETLQYLKTAMIGSVSLPIEKLPLKNLIFEKEWYVEGSNLDVRSICISKEDDHIFICDVSNQSIIEFTEDGKLRGQCLLCEGANKFTPFDICLVSPDIFVVACGWEKKLIFLERVKYPPYLRIKFSIDTERKFYSVCQMDEKIFACCGFFGVDSFTKSGQKVETIRNRISSNEHNTWPIIRANSCTGLICLAEIDIWKKLNKSVMRHFTSSGTYITNPTSQENISDFCFNEFGHYYYCNEEEFFSSSPQKCLYKFEVKSEGFTRILVSKKKLFILHKLEGKYLIKIFTVLY